DHDDHTGHEYPGGKAIPPQADGHADDAHDDGSVDLTQGQMDTFDVRTATVSGGPVTVTIERPAEVVYDENALAHVVPRVAGIARNISAAEGDHVVEGEVLAVLESRELADAKSAYLASLERLTLAKENFARAEALIDKRIVSAKAHLEAKTDYAEARINLRNARQKLFALGIGEARLNEIAEEDEADLTEYVMRAPLSGTVVARHLTRGESVPTDREAFVIADVSTVWVDISIYAHDLERIEAGQTVAVATESGLETEGKIAFVTPNVSEETRTAKARVFLANKPMRLRPGMFVTARIAVAEEPAEVRVPATALQNHEGRDVVFVKDKEGRLKPRPVTLGRRNSHYVEVLAGLRTGDTVVTDGAFVVKSQLAKSGFDDGHNH
ncbi:MAG TPA: efflux RND transporter periplasmic adaptor subunit, partial [Methyloceanibacter sp.]|nr:efflux RND transporter periplasmic adaptor subunit [Methyloceanibacter sp.]